MIWGLLRSKNVLYMSVLAIEGPGTYRDRILIRDPSFLGPQQ